MLEAEGVLIDPIGAILAALLLGIIPSGNRIDLGCTDASRHQPRLWGDRRRDCGVRARLALLRVRNIVPEGYENIFALAYVLLLYQGATRSFPTAGFSL